MKKAFFSPSLNQVFTASIVLLLGFVSYLFYSVYDSSTRSVLQISERLRDEASREISARVQAYLSRAESAVSTVERQVSLGSMVLTNPLSIENGLVPLLLDNPDIAELAVTYGQSRGYDNEGQVEIEAQGRGQFVVSRKNEGQIHVRLVKPQGSGLICAEWIRGGSGGPTRTYAIDADPTRHRTFTTPASKRLQGQVLWSDLHWPPGEQSEAHRGELARVSVQKSFAVKSWVIVVRVALRSEQINRITSLARTDPHRIFLTDNQGRLITQLSPEDRLEESGDDLRFKPVNLAPEIAQALSHPALKEVNRDKPFASIRFSSGGKDHLATFRALGGTQDWITGIVVPESHYLQGLAESRNRLLFTSAILILAILLGGILVLQGIKSAQDQITAQTGRMNRFDFTPSPYRSIFSDVNTSLESLEKAKTAMRVMGKYAPIELVRKLYSERTEPVLGGESAELTIMFTDIADFTTLSERLPPAVLSEALGRYLEAMVDVIQGKNEGTIDKFIGDAIMAFWNAPNLVSDPARRACEAALASFEAADRLYGSPAWKGIPPFVTRLGLHKDRVRVGHFGAPERMNYTAIGDGVNLASRLEGLNKQYGTRIIASRTVYDDAREFFEFRLLDRVAVKGKSQGLDVYELLGRKGQVDAPRLASARRHEEALAAYRALSFTQAMKLWKELSSDPAAQAFCERCEEYLRQPPPQGWDGTYASHSK